MKERLERVPERTKNKNAKMLTLTTSIGVDATAPPKLDMKLEL